jgi:exopolysaccharide biosynthesis polyprenyl glycosylphosphotransferase
MSKISDDMRASDRAGARQSGMSVDLTAVQASDQSDLAVSGRPISDSLPVLIPAPAPERDGPAHPTVEESVEPMDQMDELDEMGELEVLADLESADDVDEQSSVERAERRRTTTPTRHSWAAQRPFDLRTGTDLPEATTFDPVERAHQRRATWIRPLILRSVIGDAMVATVVTAICAFSLKPIRPWSVPIGLAAALVWVLAVLFCRGYEARRLGDGPDEFQSLLRASFGVIAGLGVVAYSTQVLLPRRMVLLAVPLIAVLCVVNRHLIRKELHSRRYDGLAMRRTLIVGEPTAVREVVSDLAAVKHHGYEIVGACVPVPGPEIAENLDAIVMGGISEVPQVVVDNEIDTVIVVGAQLSGTPLRRLSWALEQTGADLVVAPGLVEVTGPNVQLRPSAGLSLLLVEPPSARMGRMLLKSIIDRAVGILMLLAATPIIAVAALLVRLTSRGKAFFPQHRIGLDGNTFTMWKLRSMVQDAEARKAELEAFSDRDGLMFKMHADPRITKVGRVLRRFSLDELPQLWNVVKGDMSLVGPRPPLPQEYEAYHDAVHRRLRVRPGLTGLWQVSGRADLTWEESVRMDLRYVDNWSIALDLQILWKTARAVLRGSGAY